jgi:hypothetical protein
VQWRSERYVMCADSDGWVKTESACLHSVTGFCRLRGLERRPERRLLALTSGADRPQAFPPLKVDRQCCVSGSFSQVARPGTSDVSRGVQSVLRFHTPTTPRAAKALS